MQHAMDFSAISEIAAEAAARLETEPGMLMMYAWPQVFGSTAGPHRGRIAGQAMTTFQVLAFEAPDGQRVKWCDGLWKPWNGEQQW